MRYIVLQLSELIGRATEGTLLKWHIVKLDEKLIMLPQNPGYDPDFNSSPALEVLCFLLRFGTSAALFKRWPIISRDAVLADSELV